jgi:hypothetical protein
MVESQTTSLILGPSFCHNLCFRCPNGSWEAIFDIYTLIAFQWYEECFKARCFHPYNRALKFQEPQGFISPHFGVWVSSSHSSKSGVATTILLEDPIVNYTTDLNIAKSPLLSLGPQTTTLVPTWKHFLKVWYNYVFKKTHLWQKYGNNCYQGF